MLRIKLAFHECNLTQSELVSATGWSKGLISRVFNFGELPVDPVERQRFLTDVAEFVAATPVISEWLWGKGLTVASLFGHVQEWSEQAAALPAPTLAASLDGSIIAIAGRVAVYGTAEEETVICLSKTCLYLLAALRDQPMSMDALGEIEAAAGNMLLGGGHHG